MEFYIQRKLCVRRFGPFHPFAGENTGRSLSRGRKTAPPPAPIAQSAAVLVRARPGTVYYNYTATEVIVKNLTKIF